VSVDVARKAVPIWSAIEATLRHEIGSGMHPLGSLLPTEYQLCARFQASRFTVRQALGALRDVGMIASRPGVGSLVIAAQPRAAFVQTLNSVEELLQYPEDTVREDQRTEPATADAELATLLECKPGDPWVWLRATRRPRGADLPISWLDAWVSPRFAAVTEAPNPEGRPLLVQIERAFGATARHAQVRIMSGRVESQWAAPLRAETGSAALILLRRYRDAGGQVYLVTRSVHPEGRFSLNFEFQTT
jgi:GntR family transcriptional regulator